MEKGFLMTHIMSVLPTSKDSALTIEEIIEAITTKFRGDYLDNNGDVKKPSKDAVRDNLDRIEAICNSPGQERFGTLKDDVRKQGDDPRSHPKAYYLNDIDGFTDGQCAVLLSLILGDNTLGKNLSGKLIGIVSSKMTPTAKKSLGIMNSGVKFNEENFKLDVYYDVLLQAIHEGKKVKFQKQKFRSSSDKCTFFPSGLDISFSPYHLTSAHGKHFVIGLIDGEQKLSHFRLDAITQPKKSRDSVVTIPGAFDVNAYIAEHPYMKNTDYSTRIEFIIHEDALLDARDAFGEILPRRIDTEDRKGYYKLAVKATKEDVFRWAMINADKVEVVAPSDLRLRLVQATHKASSVYLTTDEDFYFINVENGRNSAYEYESGKTKSSKMEFMDIDFSKLKHKLHKEIDVRELSFIRCEISDISYLAGKKNLRKFYSEKNPIADYSPLCEAEGLTEITILEFPNHKMANAPKIDLSFVNKCKALRAITLGYDAEENDGLYDHRIPQLDCIRLKWGSEIDVERYKKANPLTKIEVRNVDEPLYLYDADADVHKKVDTSNYPINIIMDTRHYGYKKGDERKAYDEELAKFDGLSKKLISAINSLRDDEKNVINGIFKEGKSIYELACELDVTLGNVCLSKSTAIDHLEYKVIDDVMRNIYKKLNPTRVRSDSENRECTPEEEKEIMDMLKGIARRHQLPEMRRKARKGME